MPLRSAPFRGTRVAARLTVSLVLSTGIAAGGAAPAAAAAPPIAEDFGPDCRQRDDAVASADDLMDGRLELSRHPATRLPRDPTWAEDPFQRPQLGIPVPQPPVRLGPVRGVADYRQTRLPRPGPRTRPRLGCATIRVAGALRLRVERPLDGDPHVRTCLRSSRRPEGQLDSRCPTDPRGHAGGPRLLCPARQSRAEPEPGPAGCRLRPRSPRLAATGGRPDCQRCWPRASIARA